MQKSNEKVTPAPYAWLILALVFLGMMVSFGMRVSFGAYMSPWEKEFSTSRSIVTGVSMLAMAVSAVSQPLIGRLHDHFGKNIIPTSCLFLMVGSLLLITRANQTWQLYALYGVLYSFSLGGMSGIIAGVILSNWFVVKRGFAIGLATSGLAVGQLIFVPMNLFIIERLGWRSTLTMMSLIILAVVAPLYIIFLRNKPEEKGRKPYGYVNIAIDKNDSEKEAVKGKKSMPLINVFRHRAFWLISLAYLVCGFTDVGLINTHLVAIAEWKGFSIPDTMLAFSMIAIANIGGTILTGHLSDHFSRKRQLAVIYLIRGFTYILLIFIKNPGLFVVYSLMHGAVEMATIAPTQSLVVDIFDKYSIGTILGLITVSHQVGGAIGTWLPGLLFDNSSSYFGSLLIGFVLLVGAAAFSLGIPEPAKRARQ